MEQITSNRMGQLRRAKLHGREHLVAPLTMIVPGILNGSRGPLYYPEDEVASDPSVWNGMPIVVYHPVVNGRPVSARSPEIMESYGIGHVFNARIVGKKLVAEGWFDIEKTKEVDARVHDALIAGQNIELSTGLFADYDAAEDGATHNGRPYSHVVRNMKPDHLAVLPDQVGACSLRDGCGVGILNGKNIDITNGRWITIKGTAVYVEGGKITKGPKGLRSSGKGVSKGSKGTKAASSKGSKDKGEGRPVKGDKTKGKASSKGKKDKGGSSFEEVNRRYEKKHGTDKQNAQAKKEGFKGSAHKTPHREKREAGKAAKQSHKQALKPAGAKSPLPKPPQPKVHEGSTKRQRKTLGQHARSAAVKLAKTALRGIGKAVKAAAFPLFNEEGFIVMGDQSGSPVLNSKEEPAMAKSVTLNEEQKEKIVDALIGNCSCGTKKAKVPGPWTEEDREVLNEFSDEKLSTMYNALVGAEKASTIIANASKAGVIDKTGKVITANATKEDDEEEEDDEEDAVQPKKKGKKGVRNEESRLTPQEQEDIRWARNERKRQKEALVDKLVANVEDEEIREAKKEKFMAMNEEQLQEFASIMPEKKGKKPTTNKDESENPPANYEGAPGGLPSFLTVNRKKYDPKEDVLVPLTINYEEEAAKQKQEG